MGDWTLVILTLTTPTIKLTLTLNLPLQLPQKSTLMLLLTPTSKTTLSVLPVALMLPAVLAVQLLWESTKPLETPNAHGKPTISPIHVSEPVAFLSNFQKTKISAATVFKSPPELKPK